MPIRKNRVMCDGFGCDEEHPLDHESLGEESFGTGRWLGWIYVDLNRPDLISDVLRFCSVGCALGWMEDKVCRHGFGASGVENRPSTPLDEALRRPMDEVARKRAGLGGVVA